MKCVYLFLIALIVSSSIWAQEPDQTSVKIINKMNQDYILATPDTVTSPYGHGSKYIIRFEYFNAGDDKPDLIKEHVPTSIESLESKIAESYSRKGTGQLMIATICVAMAPFAYDYLEKGKLGIISKIMIGIFGIEVYSLFFPGKEYIKESKIHENTKNLLKTIRGRNRLQEMSLEDVLFEDFKAEVFN